MDPSLIGKFISAEIPDKDQDLIAYAAVENYMIHGLCEEVNKNSVWKTINAPSIFQKHSMLKRQ
jgi:hypothetical protein